MSIKTKLIFLIFTFLCALKSSEATSDGESIDGTQCGGVLEAHSNVSTSISYKNGKPVDAFESCIWTIHSPNRTLIKFNIPQTYFYIDDSDAYLALGYFNKSNYDLLNSFTWIRIPNAYTTQIVEVPGPVVFLHFSSTKKEPVFGFHLSFRAIGEEQVSIYHFENYFIEGEYGIFKYPSEGDVYSSNQRTTIVIKADSTVFSYQPIGQAYYELRLINMGIEDSQDCLVDNLNLYGFGEVDKKWFKNFTTCGMTPSFSKHWFFVPRNDPIIVTFKSDDSGVGKGFELHLIKNEYV